MESRLKKSAALVKTWGDSKTPDGRTLEEILTIEDIPLWSTVSSDLASTGVAKLLLESSTRTPIQGSLKRLFVNKASLALFDAKARLSSGDHGCDSWPNDEETFLCLGFSNYIYRETVEPVAARLARRAETSVVVIDDLFFHQPRIATNISVLRQTLWQHWYSTATRDITRMRKLLKDAKIYLTASFGLQQIVEESGYAWVNFQQIFSWLFNSYLPRLLVYVAIAKHCVAHHRPSLIISPDVNDPRTRIFCLAGKLESIKTIEIQFSFCGPSSVEWEFFLADHLAVAGRRNLKQMLNHGVSPIKMTVTGSPRYDHALFRSSEIDRNLRDRHGVTDGKQMVLFASQPYYYESFSSSRIRQEMIADLFDAASNANGIVLVVKPHPFDSLEELTSLARNRRNIFFADRHFDIRYLIRSADVFITFFSTTTFDALVMGKPTINLAYPGGYHDKTFQNSGATLRAKSDIDIREYFRSISMGRITALSSHLSIARGRLLSSWFYELDGCAAERIEAIALEMISKRKAYCADSINKE